MSRKKRGSQSPIFLLSTLTFTSSAFRLQEWRNRAQEERDAQEFPDEIDTPRDIPAREWFARYRGLRSLRTSPWDAYENLPPDYARIFEFEDFKRTERDMRRVAEVEGVAVCSRSSSSPFHILKVCS